MGFWGGGGGGGGGGRGDEIPQTLNVSINTFKSYHCRC